MTNLTVLCSINICQNNGKCFLVSSGTITTPYCLCNRCFSGNQCEIEEYSKNLWLYSISEENKRDHNAYNESLIIGILGIISIISNLLSLQTFSFTTQVRETNLGVYLIVYSFIGFIISTIQSVFGFMNVTSNFENTSELNHSIQCFFIHAFRNSLNYCLYWFWLYIALERVLIEYTYVSLYDSRRRSLISSLLLILLLPLSNVLPILFGQKNDTSNLSDFCLLNFTSVGYQFYSIVDCINYIAAPLSFIVACVFIFKHLIGHRRNLANDESFRSSLILIASKHYDFFVPPVVFCLLTSPHFIFDKMMDCLRADSIAVSRTQTATQLLSDSAWTLTFFIYVYLSKIYLTIFWDASPVGRCLIYVRKRCINSRRHRVSVFSIDDQCTVLVAYRSI